jgi:hypothetical protein
MAETRENHDPHHSLGHTRQTDMASKSEMLDMLDSAWRARTDAQTDVAVEEC